MADFCKQCSEELFGEDTKDMAGLSTSEDDAEGKCVAVLCEGCGPTHVNSKGECLHHAGRTSRECFNESQTKQETKS